MNCPNCNSEQDPAFKNIAWSCGTRFSDPQWRTYACRRIEIEHLRDRVKRLEAFVNRFLSPEDLGYCINECMRDEAREALGMERVIMKEAKP